VGIGLMAVYLIAVTCVVAASRCHGGIPLRFVVK
jgi:hypothetical protein